MGTNWSRIATVLVFFLNPFAYSAEQPPYHVEVDSEPGAIAPVIHISFETREQQTSICHRTTTRLVIILPQTGADAVEVPPSIGRIEFDTELKPGTICLAALGPHSGGVELLAGEYLPRIPDGHYLLRIDGDVYGVLFVDDGEVALLRDADIPR